MSRPALLPLVLLASAAAGQSPPEPRAVFKGHADPVYAVAFSPDGGRVATGSFDKSIKLWDAASGKELATFGGKAGHQNQVLAVAFSPDGTKLASGGSDNAAKLWDARPGRPAARAAVLGAAAAALPDTPTASLAHPNLVDSVAFDHTGTLLATGCHDGVVRVWDVAKGQAAKEIKAHVTAATPPVASPVYAVAWSPDGKFLASASYDKTVKVWDAAAGTLVREVRPGVDRTPLEPAVGTAAPAVLGPAGGWLTAPPDDGHRDQVFAVVFDKPGTRLATGSSDRRAVVWDFATLTVVRPLADPALPKPVLGSPPASHNGFVNGVRFSPDGSKLVTVGSAPRGQGHLAVWSVADGRKLAGWELPHGPAHALDVSPDGSAVVVGFGVRSRDQSECDAVVFPLPK